MVATCAPIADATSARTCSAWEIVAEAQIAALAVAPAPIAVAVQIAAVVQIAAAVVLIAAGEPTVPVVIVEARIVAAVETALNTSYYQ